MADKFPWFTGAGDDGSTGLLGSGRVPKFHAQPETFGAVDEASAAIGVARASLHAAHPDVDDILLQTQRDCYGMMAELAADRGSQKRFRKIDAARVTWLSEMVDRIGARVEMPREFVVPGDSGGGAHCDLARTIVRRAERRVAQLTADGLFENRDALAYLNRLSSLLFVIARLADAGTNGGPTLARD